jgi:predicted DNA-binding transcriptional regulator YafY
MTTQKSAYRRYATIDRCLNSPHKKYWTKEELMAEVQKIDIEIKPRTFDNDIYDMRNETGLTFKNAPIDYDRKLKGYYYTAPFSISIPIDNEDIQRLELAEQILTQYQNIPYFSQFSAAIDKVIRIVKEVKETDEGTHRSFILFEKIPNVLGYEYLDPILNAIKSEQSISVTYKKFDGDSSFTVTVHPYFVKEFHNRWYFVGYCESGNGLRTYALDRIKEIVNAASPYITNTAIVPEDYFKDCIGIDIQHKEIVKVVLAFSPRQSNYVRTQDIHRSQRKIKDDEQGVHIQLDLMINYELIMLILSYGAEVQVLEPVTLALQIKEISKNVNDLYTNIG